MGYYDPQTLDSTTSFGNVSNQSIIIDIDDVEAFVIRQDGDAGDVVVVDTLDPSSAHANPPIVFDIQANGGVAFAGSANQVTYLRVSGELNSGTQSGRIRGIEVLPTFSGDVIHTGTGGSAIRSANFSMAWNSTGAASGELVGLQNTIFAGGGGGVDTGLIDDAICNRVNFGFNVNDSGAFTEGTGFKVIAPKNVDATHTIVTARGLHVEDMFGTGITIGVAIDIEDQSTGGFSIRTKDGRVEFGDETIAYVSRDLTKLAAMRI